MSGDTAMLKAAGIWEKISAKGNRYFVGRLGGVRILILENRVRGTEGEPDFHLFFADSSSDKPRAEARNSAPRARRPSRQQHRAEISAGASLPDDRLDDLCGGAR